ncbi:MAG: hypothetical protein B7Z68_09975, partial [Acidobacteria bacterium 21-70-11]
MEMKTLTKTEIKKLSPRDKRYDVYDDPSGAGGVRGLVVTVQPSGVKTWYLIRKVRGQVERVKIGRAEDFDLERARKKAGRIAGQIAEGRSPAAEKRAIR